jgi:shikimate kinase
MVLREENIKKMKQQGRILLLQAAPETIYERVKDSTNRPLLNGHMDVEYIGSLMAEREPAYKAAADLCVDTDGLSPRQVAEKILALPE